MLKQRIITALVLLPLVVFVLFFLSLENFALAIVVLVYIMGWEWAALSGLSHPVARSLFALLSATNCLLIWYFSDNLIFWPSVSWPEALLLDIPLVILISACAGFIGLLMIVFNYPAHKSAWTNFPARAAIGLLYLAAFFVAFVSIRGSYYESDFHFGSWLLLFMFFVIWAADVGAYFSGKSFGKNKLAPRVSPKKTWEGVYGGAVLSVVVGLVFYHQLYSQQTLAVWWIVAGIIVLVAVSIVGDLFESVLKRETGIKDSSQLLPGHGGVLDRLDSTLTVAPFFALITSLFGIA